MDYRVDVRKEEGYFVFDVSEDGDVSFECISKEELTKRLNEDYWGVIDPENPYFWIVKGKLVKPYEKKIVTEYDIE